VHLEEDTANNKHRGEYSLIDFNRAGIPLMELVTEPRTFNDSDGEAAKAASNLAKELQLILWYLEVSGANMEKGEMRVEANISVSENPKKLGTKVEVKNLNSFRSVERAIKSELDRMIALLREGKGNEIIQETRGWDESKQKTFSQRKKEASHDYRYFPEPDLLKMYLHTAFDLAKMKEALPELPAQKRLRYQKDFAIKDEDIESYINDPELALWFEEIAKILIDSQKIKTASNYITSDYLGLKKTNLEARPPGAGNFAELIEMVFENKISSRAAKNILARIAEKDESPMKIAEREDLLQKNDAESLKKIAQKIIENNPKAAADYRKGKENALMSLVGQIMKETKGAANPQLVRRVVLDLLAHPEALGENL
jgi:aspartyl-tRNA(Asn)/glutamyl-tRNA(Gln) amidotransferase subunit B